MPRFAGVRDNSIRILSDNSFASDDLHIVEIPSELHSIPSEQLVSDFKFKNGHFVSKRSHKPASELRVAVVGNYLMKCGIATYSYNLWPHVVKHLNDYKLFVEKNDNPTSEPNLPADKIIQCWERGKSLQELVSEIKDYNPDIVWIQSEFGLWPNARYWLSMISQLSEYRIITTMHSTFHHRDKTICEAAIPEIIVHLDGAKRILKEEKCISSNVYVIPHGCFPCTNKERLWNIYKSERTFIQQGFGFRYKNFQASIMAAAILKQKYDDVFFTGLLSETDFNQVEHQLYFDDLMKLVEELDLKDNVALIRGFQSNEVLDSFYRTNKAAVFPYLTDKLHEVFGASGAAREAATKNIPIITSSANHFSDLPTIKADTPEDIAMELDKLFSSKKAVEWQLDRQNKYLDANSWEKVAEKYIRIFERSSDD
jgi:glycosyltransferase involved in cell wall biosynthesis